MFIGSRSQGAVVELDAEWRHKKCRPAITPDGISRF